MFGIGAAELWILAATVCVLTLAWHAWRARWVSVSREWLTDLDVAEVEAVLGQSFASVPGGKWRAQADGSWVFSVRRVPLWAVLLGLFTLPLGLLLFLVRETADLHLHVSGERGECRVRAIGRTPGPTLEALDSWLTRMAEREQV